MNWQSRGGAVQSEIGLMLPTTTPGPCSRDEREASQKGLVTFPSRSKQRVFFLRQINGVSLPKIFLLISHAVRGGDMEWLPCIADP